MTILHILNYVIPIGCMIGIGFWMGYLYKPSVKLAEDKNNN
ncbi:hypothetical protein [Peribacillus saganii]|nr:hypothetical protein [Peribacillus saganii]